MAFRKGQNRESTVEASAVKNSSSHANEGELDRKHDKDGRKIALVEEKTHIREGRTSSRGSTIIASPSGIGHEAYANGKLFIPSAGYKPLKRLRDGGKWFELVPKEELEKGRM